MLGRAVTFVLIAAGILLATCTAVYLAGARPITVDEVEYFRATDWVGQGLVPYRDFFEHHLPLQWYLFAPALRLVGSPGAAAIIAARLLQVPLWILTFGALLVWMRDAGLSPRARLAAIVALLASALFVMPAIEYRVDTVSTAAIAAAMALAERRRGLYFAGALLALSVLANVRCAVVAAVVTLLLLVIDVTRSRWARPAFSRVFAIAVGAAVPVAIYAAYLFATKSAQSFWTAIIVNNAAIDRLAHLHARATLLATVRIVLASADAGTILLLVAGVITALRLDWRRPSRLHLAAVVAAINLLFVVRMPVQYFYHFQITLLTCAVLLASLAERAETVIAGLIVVATLITAAFAARSSLDAIGVQDMTMRAAQMSTRPGETIFDGSGFALRRSPAYRYWFLPLGVRLLAKAGLVEPYTPAALMRNPPAAVLFDPRLSQWVAEWPDLRRAIVQHYVPRWRNVWLPGGSGIIGPGGEVTIEIVRDGDYRVVATPALLQHPWFRRPVDSASIAGPDASRLTIDVASMHNAAVEVVGVSDAARPFSRRRGERVVIRSHDSSPVGVFLFPASAPRLFEVPDRGLPMIDPLFSLR